MKSKKYLLININCIQTYCLNKNNDSDFTEKLLNDYQQQQSIKIYYE